MAYDEILAQRFLSCINFTENISQKRMMGGACFMVNGNMIGGADRQKTGEARFMFRVGKGNQTEALSRVGAIPIVHGDRQMGGMVFVDGKKLF